jgi:hypothetical protein
MRGRPRSGADKLLLGVVCVTVLLATSLGLALASDLSREPSGVVGTVIARPCSPVERADDPPCPGYFGDIRVLRRDGGLVTTSHTDRDGRFRIDLPPGRYVIDPDDGGKSLANGDGRVTVREGTFAPVELTHYTGLR